MEVEFPYFRELPRRTPDPDFHVPEGHPRLGLLGMPITGGLGWFLPLMIGYLLRERERIPLPAARPMGGNAPPPVRRLILENNSYVLIHIIHGSELRNHVKTSRIPVGQAFENHDVLQKRSNPLFHEFHSRPSPKCQIFQKKVSATDPDCGVNAMVNYTIGDSKESVSQLTINQVTGEICIFSPLDYETKPIYEFPVIATDRGGLSTRAIVRIQLTDVNDNWPVFYPKEYNVSVKEGAGRGGPLLTVAATDLDSGRFGTLTYSISAGNPTRAFTVNPQTDLTVCSVLFPLLQMYLFILYYRSPELLYCIIAPQKFKQTMYTLQWRRRGEMVQCARTSLLGTGRLESRILSLARSTKSSAAGAQVRAPASLHDSV
ncbi:unnamed protein product [Nesidiocoris tenuis]|uniref:Cadherin domain-containing protein n=1 Tax=Nesidiocoris tenuis TaxID=355587 RepID=A0A6H5GLQ6_9HEMI|nr:unnamed protein product [Nesidiocoris tenuis]